MSAGAPELPTLEGADVYLRPVMPNDYPHLQALETASEAAPMWRFRGATVSPERWAQVLWQSVLVQMLVIARDQNTPLGLLVVYRPEFQDGHAYFAAYNFDPEASAPSFMLGTALFLRYCFACWPLRKLYMETDEFNYEQFASGAGRWFEVEGRLREHTYLAGRYWDRLILTIDREQVGGLLETVARAAVDEPVTVNLAMPATRPRPTS